MILCTDLHFNRNNYKVVAEVLEQALQLAIDTNSPLASLGDLNDSKALLRAEYVNVILDLFKKYESVEKHLLVGNHSLLNVKNDKDHCLEFLRGLPNVKIYDNKLSASERVYENIGFIPYKNDLREIDEDVAYFKEVGVNILFMHQGIKGAMMNGNIPDKDGYSSPKLNDFNVFVGHYHMPHHVNDNIYYIGSSLSHSFGEANQDKGFIDLDIATGIYERIPSKAPRHISYTITEENLDITQTHTPVDYVRVVLKGSKNWINTIDKTDIINLLQLKPKFVHDIVSEEKVFEYNKTDDHLTLLNKFVEAQNINNKELIKTKIMELAREVQENTGN